MNKVLMSGLAVGKDVGLCAPCNFDFSWVLACPAMLVWSDSIIVTPSIWNQLISGAWPADWPELAQALKVIFEIVGDAGVVEVRDPCQVVTQDVADLIWKQAEADQTAVWEAFPGQVSIDSRGMMIEGVDYCLPYVASLYSILLLSAAWGTHCFLDDRALNYWKYRFGSSAPAVGHALARAEGFQAVFDAYLPNEPLSTSYLACSAQHRDKLSTCEHRGDCGSNSLRDIEKKVTSLLRWRDYDEVHQLREVVERIVQHREKAGGAVNPPEVVRDVKALEGQLNRRVRLVFPKVQRWADIITMLSVPTSLTGAGTGNSALSWAGASLTAIGQLGKLAVDVLKSHYSWIGFNPKEARRD